VLRQDSVVTLSIDTTAAADLWVDSVDLRLGYSTRQQLRDRNPR
jgi:hypothetical protein